MDHPRTTPASPTTPRALLAVAIASMLVAGLSPDGVVGAVAILGANAAAAALAWVGVARHRPEDRGPWRLVALAATLTMGGNLVYEAVLGAPDGASIAEPIWYAAYLALITGLLRLEPREVPRFERDADTLVDALVALLVGAVIAWEVAIDGLLTASGMTVVDRVVAGVYPVLDVVLLAVVVRILLRAAHTRPLLLAAFGALLLLGGDLVYAADTDGDRSSWIDVVWSVSTVLLVSSTLPGRRAPRPAAVVQRTRIWMVLLPVAVPIGFLVRGQITHDHPNSVLMAVSAAALLGLAVQRAGSLLRAVEGAKRAVQEREHRFRALAANAADVVIVVDPVGRVKQGAAELAAALGVEARMLETTPTMENELVEDPAAVQHLLLRSVNAPGVVFQQETGLTLPDGTERCMAVRLSNLLDDPVVGGIVVNIHDVTHRKRAEDALRHSALHDPLTGLANRALLRDRIEQALRRGPRPGTAPALLHLDIDGFKSVNARHGREVGDRLLQAVAGRLETTTRSEDTVARLGADELAVFIEDSHADTGEALTTAERCLQALGAPIVIDDVELTVSASIGVAVAERSTRAGDLMRNADIALHRAKTAGPGQVVGYDEAMGSLAGEAAVLRDELAGAAERGELVVHYQPVVRLTTGVVVGFEALLRWDHPRLGRVAPDRFVPLAEETGLIVPIGRWVLETACTEVAGWRRPDGTPVQANLGVNLSGRQLGSDGVVDDVRRALAVSGLDPERLVLEMTETALVADPAAAAGRLNALKALGVSVAIDDFGTGYSSLAYLRQFPIDILKIDRSFVETITDADELPPIVRGLLDLGHTLGLEVVAEGIERPVQADGLRTAGCDVGQGYLFARPVPSAEAHRYAGTVLRTSPIGVNTGV